MFINRVNAFSKRSLCLSLKKAVWLFPKSSMELSLKGLLCMSLNLFVPQKGHICLDTAYRVHKIFCKGKINMNKALMRKQVWKI